MDEDADWRRFDLYAAYVRKLWISYFELKRDNIGIILEEMTYARWASCLVPNLEELIIDPGYRFYLALSFLNKGLKNLNIESATLQQSHVGAIFIYILPKVPDLTHLRLALPQTSLAMNSENALQHALRQFKSLRSLKIENTVLLPSTLSLILLLPSLQHFSYELFLFTSQNIEGNVTSASTGEANGDEILCSPLEKLEVIPLSENIDHVLCPRLVYPRLEEFTVKLVEQSGEHTAATTRLQAFCKMVSVRMNNMNNLCLTLSCIPMVPADGKVVNVKHLRVLSNLPQMQHFSVSFMGIAISVTDMDIEYLARSWQHLISFCVSTDYCVHGPSTTLQILQSFGCHCKKLELLSIEVDCSKKIQYPQRVEPLRNLKVLDFGYFSIAGSDAESVASYLCRFCTSSCHLTVPKRDESADAVTWNAVAMIYNQTMKATEEQSNF